MGCLGILRQPVLIPMEKSMKIKQLISFLLLLACVIAAATVLSGCEREKNKYVSYSLDYFDTVTTITGYEYNKEEFDEISDMILGLLGEYHRLYTIYHSYTGIENLYSINSLTDGEHRVVKVDSRIIDMLTYAKAMYDLTDGKMNIAMGSVLSIWHNYRNVGMNNPASATLPPMEKLLAAAEHTDINNLIIDNEASTVFISDPEMTLDVGAVAKGYAVEMIARELEQMGITGYVLNVGGNVRTIGTKPNGDKWIAGIENPDTTSDEGYIRYLLLDGETIVTSGSYQRFYMVDGVSYHHIVDSDTLMPAEGYLSVSVVCKNSAHADSLSTALFCMELEAGRALVESLDGVEVLWVLSDGSTVETSGFGAYVTQI